MNDREKYFVLRSKTYKKGDRYGFYEYTLYKDEWTGKKLTSPEPCWERLKYAEIFDSKVEALSIKAEVDKGDKLLEVVCLRKAEEEY
tara:strand:- start:586 stop:846 length:261 start_codon:yes stop_codon:yes gene_type:complete